MFRNIPQWYQVFFYAMLALAIWAPWIMYGIDRLVDRHRAGKEPKRTTSRLLI